MSLNSEDNKNKPNVDMYVYFQAYFNSGEMFFFCFNISVFPKGKLNFF